MAPVTAKVALAETVEELIARWRTTADGDNPAGPLYAAGDYAETDIAAPHMITTFTSERCSHVSICTGSGTIDCC